MFHKLSIPRNVKFQRQKVRLESHPNQKRFCMGLFKDWLSRMLSNSSPFIKHIDFAVAVSQDLFFVIFCWFSFSWGLSLGNHNYNASLCAHLFCQQGKSGNHKPSVHHWDCSVSACLGPWMFNWSRYWCSCHLQHLPRVLSDNLWTAWSETRSLPAHRYTVCLCEELFPSFHL